MRRVRFKSDSEPWINADILAGIRRRNVLFSKVKRCRGDAAVYKDYCFQRNKVQRDIKSAKADFFSGKVEECAGDSGKLWRQLGTLGFKASKGVGGIVLESDGVKHFDPGSVSDLFNKLYTSVASSLVDALPASFNLFGYDFCERFYRSKGIFGPVFSLSPVPSLFIRNQLFSLKVDKSTGFRQCFCAFLERWRTIFS